MGYAILLLFNKIVFLFIIGYFYCENYVFFMKKKTIYISY